MARKRLEVEIAGDAGGAEAALAGTGAALDALSDKRIEIKAEDNELRRKVVEDKELIASLGTEEGKAHLGLDDEGAKAKIAELKADIDSIGLKRARLAVDDADARARIAVLKGELDSIHDKDVKVHVDEDGKARERVSELGKKFDETAGKIPTLVAAAGALGPALVPAAAAATAGIGAMLVPLTAASLGFGALGIFAREPLQQITKEMGKINPLLTQFEASSPGPQQALVWGAIQAQIAKVPPDLRPVVQGMVDLKLQISDLGKAVRPDLFHALTTGLGAAHTLLPQLVPAAREAALSLNDLGTSVTKGLASPAWQHFIFTITPEIRPAIDSIGRSFGNLVKGLGGVVEAFTPFAGAFESGMERITRSFANWGQNLGSSQGFQHFMDYLRQNGPQLKTTLEDIGRAGESFVKALGAFGGVNLKILDDLAKAIIAISSAPGGAAAIEITALALALGKLASIAKLGTVITDLARIPAAIRAFQGTEGIIGGAGAALGALGGKGAEAGKGATAAAGGANTLKAVLPGVASTAAGAAGSAGLGGLAVAGSAAAVALPLVAIAAWAVAKGNAPAANATQTLNQQLREQVAAAGPAAQAGGNLANSFQNVQDKLHITAPAFADLIGNLQNAGVNMDHFDATATTASADVVSGLQRVASGATGATPQVQQAARDWLAAIQTVPPGAATAGDQTGSSFGNGVASATGAVSAAAKGLGAAAEANAHADLSGAGANAGQSFASGVASAVGAAAAAGAAVANAAAAAAAAHQQSPDARTLAIGANAGLGYALGIEQQVARVLTATERLTGAAYGGLAASRYPAGPSSYGGAGGQAARIVHIAEGAVQVSVGAEAQRGDVASAVNTALGQLVRELRAT